MPSGLKRRIARSACNRQPALAGIHLRVLRDLRFQFPCLLPMGALLPAPQRGEIVRQLGNAMRDHKQDLGALVTLGKTPGRVVRHIEGGFAIEFTRLQHPDFLEENVTSP